MSIKNLLITAILALGPCITCSAFSVSNIKKLSAQAIVTTDEIASVHSHSSSFQQCLLKENCYSTFRLAAVTNDDPDSTKRNPPGIQSYLTQLDQLSSDFSQNVYGSERMTSQSRSQQPNDDNEVKPKNTAGVSSYLTQLEMNSKTNDADLTQLTTGTALENVSNPSDNGSPEKRTNDQYGQNSYGAKSYLSQLGQNPTTSTNFKQEYEEELITNENNGAGVSQQTSLKTNKNNSGGRPSYLVQLQQATKSIASDEEQKKKNSIGSKSYLDQLQKTSSPLSSDTIPGGNDIETKRSFSSNSVGTQSYLDDLQKISPPGSSKVSLNPSLEKEKKQDVSNVVTDEVKSSSSGFGSYLAQLDKKATDSKSSKIPKSNSPGIGSYLTQLEQKSEVSASDENSNPLDVQSTTKSEPTIAEESPIVEKSTTNSGFNSYMEQLGNASKAKPPISSSNTNVDSTNDKENLRSSESKANYSGFGSYMTQLEQKSNVESKKNINISLNKSSSSTGIVSYLDILGTSSPSTSEPEVSEKSPNGEVNNLEMTDSQEKDLVSPISQSKTLDATPNIKGDDSEAEDIEGKVPGESDATIKTSESIIFSDSPPISISSETKKSIQKKGPTGRFRSGKMKKKEFDIQSQEKINERNRKILEEAIASALGGTVLGLASGVAIDAGNTYDIIDLDLPAEPPAAFSILLGGGTFIATNQDNAFSNNLRRLTGGTIIKAGEDFGTSVKTNINNTITNITAFPGRVVDGAKKSISNQINKTIIEPVQSVIDLPKRKMDDLKVAAKKRKEQKAKLETRREEIAKVADTRKVELKAKREAAAAAKQAKIAERNAKKQQAIESRKTQANAKRQVAVAAAEARKAKLEEKRQLTVTNEVMKLTNVEVEAKKVWTEAKRQEAIAAAESKRRDTELKRTVAANEKRQSRQSNSMFSMFKKPTKKDIEFQERALAESEKKVAEAKRELAIASGNLLQKQKETDAANRKKEAAELALANAKAKKTEQDLKTDAAKQTATAAQAKANALLEKVETSKNSGSKKTKPRILSFKMSRRGTPTLEKWRRNRNGSVTGFIRNSKLYEDGERVTTSPIVKGSFKSGEVVETGTGSKYYLM